jgi:hypothetical protein
MLRILRQLVLAALLGVAQVSVASFHLMNIEEVYSNADGTIQYLVLHVNFDGQNLMATHNIQTTGPGNLVQTYVFLHSLPNSSTNGHRVLIGTSGFAALNLVTPDFTVPNGFFPTANGMIDYAGVVFWNYAALPTDGVNALYENGVVNPNVATNFAGASAAVIPAPTQLVITSVNGGFYPLAGSTFTVTVQAQDSSGVPRSVVADQPLTLSLHTGTGPLGGTLGCVVPNGQNSCTFPAVQYAVQDVGVSVTASCTCALTAGNSALFNVISTPGPMPILMGAASRRVHGAAGAFDLPLGAVPTSPTTEPRQGPAQTIVFTFDKPIAAATAAVIEGIATAAAPIFVGNEVIVGLTGVTDQQYVTVSLTNVSAADGGTGASGSVRLGFLLGDVNQSRVVSVGDLGLVNAQLAQPVNAANFLKDVNATGTLTVGDKGITNANLTRALPPP